MLWNGCPTGETDLYVTRFSRNKKANFARCNVATARKCQRKIGAIIDKINLRAEPHAPTKKEAERLVELKRTFWDSWYCGRKLCAIERRRCVSSRHWRMNPEMCECMEVGLMVVEPNMKSIVAPVLDPTILMSMEVLLRGPAERTTKSRIAARAVAPSLEAGDLKPGAVLEFTRRRSGI
jgi:hypothetical protein